MNIKGITFASKMIVAAELGPILIRLGIRSLQYYKKNNFLGISKCYLGQKYKLKNNLNKAQSDADNLEVTSCTLDIETKCYL
jgi:hypothetical protein